MSDHFLFKEESSLINGAVFEVHKRLGIGMLEKVYNFNEPYITPIRILNPNCI